LKASRSASTDDHPTEQPLSRIPLPAPESLTSEQRRVYDAIIAGPRGTMIGPLRAALHNPDLADRWQQLGEVLRFSTSLNPRLKELAIIVTARRWNSHIEWYVHATAAKKSGLEDYIIEAVRLGEPPEFENPDDAAVYEFARELQACGQVSDTTYDAVIKNVGTVGVVELTALIGYYTMVAMTLNAHKIPMPDGVPEPLQSVMGTQTKPAAFTALTEIPPSRLRSRAKSASG
jgi:4-carboxymuconolactone decarboxylase